MDVFDLVAKIRLDSSEYEQGVGKAKGTFSTLASGVKNGLATVTKVGAAAVSAGVAGVAALTKMGVDGYAQYEQLSGGVETLFKASQGAVMKYAENAYKTSGLSANAYMETVTSFSASLIKSLDGDTTKAASVADMAITDMSDNANKMGTSIDMIQNAYNGFAKGNFTMLDNLKLGYGGTQEEMKKLLKDAEKISGIKYDISSFADISEAIHVIQQDLEISGISYEEAMQKVANGEMTMEEAMAAMGTTAREAATTIEGSLSMMKGAWQNLVVGMADQNSNMELLINNFVESTATAAQNLLPRIEQTLSGIAQVIERLAPIIGEAVPQLVESVLPSLLSAGINLVAGLVSGIVSAAPGIYQAFLDAVYMALTDVFGMSEESANTFVSTFDGIVQALIAFIQAIPVALNWMVTQAQTEGTIFNTIWETIKTVVSAAVEIIKNVINTFTAILTGDWRSAWESVGNILTIATDAINEVITRVLTGVIAFVSDVLEKLVSFFSEKFEAIRSDIASIWENIKAQTAEKWNNIKSFIFGVWEGIKSGVSSAINAVSTTISSIWNSIKSVTSTVWNGIKSIVGNIWNNIKTNTSDAINGLKTAISTAWNIIKTTSSNVWNGIKTTLSNIWNGIKTTVSNTINGIKTTITNVWNAVKTTTSTVFNGIKTTITNIWNGIKTAVTTVVNGVKTTVTNVFNGIKTAVSTAMEAIKSGISNAWNNVKSSVSGAINNVKSTISSGLNSAKSTVSTVLENIKSKFTTIFDGAKTIVKNAINAIKGFFNFSWELPSIKLPHFSISGEFSLDPPSIPTFSISWYKKAYNNAMVLNTPTIFGYSNGKLLGGGDGNGNEIVAGESHLMGLIGHVVESKTAGQNEKIILLLSALLEAIVDGNTEMVQALMSDRTFAVGEREFARLVRTYA